MASSVSMNKCIFLSLIFIFSFLFNKIYSEHNERLELLISRIENGVTFYEKNYKDVNIDGIFGLRVIEGELLFLISQSEYAFDSSSKLPSGLVKRLRALQERARNAAENALPSLQQAAPDYYKRLGFLVESSWRPTVYYRKVSSSSRWPGGGTPVSINEKLSDGCIEELHEAIVHNDNPDYRTSCRFSARCLEHMVQAKHTFGYGILHQILYIQIVQKLGCLSSLNSVLSRNGSNAYQLTAELCANAHGEMSQTLEATNSFQNLQSFNSDLFCEQLFVCANVGYMEFVNVSYLPHLLSWQRPSGCFFRPEIAMQRRHLMADIVKDGCSSHMTAVALGALSAYLRLFLDFNIQMYFPDLPAFPRLIIEERNQIQRRNLPQLLDDWAVDDAERRRLHRGDDKDSFRPLWPGHHRSVLPREPGPANSAGDDAANAAAMEAAAAEAEVAAAAAAAVPSGGSSFRHFLQALFNLVLTALAIATLFILIRRGYFLRLLAYFYRQKHSVFLSV